MSCVKACAYEYVGYVVKTHFRDGAYIKRGAALFNLNTALLQAEISLKKAELSHSKAVVAEANASLKAAPHRKLRIT